MFDAPWYGLWPLEHACAVGKPIFCAASLARDDAFADVLVGRVRAARLPVLMALPEAVAPAQVRLARLLSPRSWVPPAWSEPNAACPCAVPGL